ncbi:c-module-binding factor [Cordyceps javanica]|nr:c-module-binding factor [Cordyceps javanica]
MPAASHPQAKFDPISPDLDLHSLVDEVPNLKWAQRVSLSQLRSLGPQEFEKLVLVHVITGGKPLVIEGFDAVLPKWLFSSEWLEKKYDKKEERVRDIVSQSDIPMTTGHYLRSMKQLTNQWTPSNFRDERRQRLYLKDIDCPPEWHEALQKIINPVLFYLNSTLTRTGAQTEIGDEQQQPSNEAASAGDLMSSLPREMRAENLMCYVGHEGTYTPAHREMCASLGQNIMVEASGDANGEKPGSSIWFMTESKDRAVVREYFLSMLGHDIEIEKHFAQVNAWKKAPFDVYVVDQHVGHDTRSVADDRSVEALVDFRLHNLAWLKAAGEESRGQDTRRMQRLREQADTAKAVGLNSEHPEDGGAETVAKDPAHTSYHHAGPSTLLDNGRHQEGRGATDPSFTQPDIDRHGAEPPSLSAPWLNRDQATNGQNRDDLSYPDPSIFVAQRIGMGYYEQDDTPDKILFDPYQAPTAADLREDEPDVPEFVKRSIRSAKRKAKRENEDPDFIVRNHNRKRPRLQREPDFLDSMDPALFNEVPTTSTQDAILENGGQDTGPSAMVQIGETEPKSKENPRSDAKEPLLRHAKPLTSYVEMDDVEIEALDEHEQDNEPPTGKASKVLPESTIGDTPGSIADDDALNPIDPKTQLLPLPSSNAPTATKRRGRPPAHRNRPSTANFDGQSTQGNIAEAASHSGDIQRRGPGRPRKSASSSSSASKQPRAEEGNAKLSHIELTQRDDKPRRGRPPASESSNLPATKHAAAAGQQFMSLKEQSYQWNCDDSMLHYYGQPHSGPNANRVYQQGYISPINPFIPSGWIGTCKFPQITAEGLVDSWQHGADLYGVYHDLLGFLPSRGSRGLPPSVKYRVTNNLITSQVVGMVINAMWDITEPVPILVQAQGVDSLEPQYQCKASSDLFNAIKSDSNVQWRQHLDLAADLWRTLDDISGVPRSDSGFHESFDHYYDNLSSQMRSIAGEIGSTARFIVTAHPLLMQALDPSASGSQN